MTLIARIGDVGFTQGSGFFQKAIRYATTGPREERSWANHTLLFSKSGIVVPSGPGISPRWQAHAIEALGRVEENPWWERHNKEDGYRIKVYRPDFLTETGAQKLVEYARSHVGDRYGWWKLGTHLLDRLFFEDKKTFSKLLRIDDRPICSYLVARAYEMAGWRYAFGDLEPGAQDPDEQMDYCEASRDYSPVHMLTWTYIGEGVIRDPRK